MLDEMMKQCCGNDGKLNFEKMKQFMQRCGKTEFGDEQIAMIEQFCGQEGTPSVEKMKALMEKCDCRQS